jgi:branched-chain amino acid transport system permease protein
VPEVLRIVFLLWRPIGGVLHGAGAGYRLKGLEGISMAEIYWLALSVAIISFLIIRSVLSSRFGLGLAAIRDSDSTAASSGVNVFILKLFSFLLGATVTGLAGGIFYTYQKYIEPTSAFSIRWTMILMLSSVIGGLGIEVGPIFGTLVVVFLHFFLARYPGWNLLIQGALLIIIMLIAPKGMTGFIRKIRARE